MGKRKNRKYGNKQSDVKKDREKDIKLYAEALYLALKKYDEESKANSYNIIKDTDEKEKSRQVRTALRIVFLPFLSNKKIITQGKIYIELLGCIVSIVISLLGWIIWLAGILVIIASSVNINNIGLFRTLIFVFMGIVLLVIGGSTIFAGRKLEEEGDSTDIYAYTSSIIALLSFILAIIALVISYR